jgi:hypothetical protein
MRPKSGPHDDINRDSNADWACPRYPEPAKMNAASGDTLGCGQRVLP